jgi:hypothetical protein
MTPKNQFASHMEYLSSLEGIIYFYNVNECDIFGIIIEVIIKHHALNFFCAVCRSSSNPAFTITD